MTSAATHGIIRGRAAVLTDDSPDIPEGTEVLIVPLRGHLTGAEILEILRCGPQVSDEDVDELERLIAEGERPVEPISVFQDCGVG